MIASARLELSASEAEAVVKRRQDQITPPEPPVRRPGQRPLAVLIGGPPGSGKSTTQWLLQLSLGANRVAVYDFDDDITAHPRYDAIMRSWGLRGGDAIAKNLPEGILRRCLDHLRRGEHQYDVIASAPLHRIQVARHWVDGFRDVDYRVALAYVVTHESVSALGRVSRLQQSIDDTKVGRWVRPELGSLSHRLMPDTAQQLEVLSYVDDLYLVDRDGYVLYENHRGADGLLPEPWRVKEEIVAERNRPPTEAEHALFLATALPLLDRAGELPGRVADELRDAQAKHEARGAPQPRAAAHPDRLDQRVSDLWRVTSSGLAVPGSAASQPPTAPAPPTHRPPKPGRER
jgi:hypothetical protein